jgi:hypothetical protein
MIVVANNSALGRKHLYKRAFLALSCICLVYELRNLDQDSSLLPFTFEQGLATLLVEETVSTGSRQDR